MKKISIICIILLCLALFSILSAKHDSVYLVNSLFAQMSKELNTKYNMRTVGTNVSMPGGIVRQIGLQFQIRIPISQDEARKILIESAELFAQAVNADKDLRPFLKNYPFTAKNIYIILYLADPQGREICHPKLGVADICSGILTYQTYERTDCLKIKDEWSESYEDAIKLLKLSETRS